MATLLINDQAVTVKDAEQALDICESELSTGFAVLVGKNSIRVVRAGLVHGTPEIHAIGELKTKVWP